MKRLELGADAAAVVAGIESAAQAAGALEAAGFRTEAVRLCAHALPRREAVWWACMCARAVPLQSISAADIAALNAAETWVRKPGDEALRRAAWDAAQVTDFRSPEAWAAVGAFWSGGSLAPEGQPVIPPADHLTGVAVCGAVVLASVRARPERADARLTRFLVSVRDIAGGGTGRIPVEEN